MPKRGRIFLAHSSIDKKLVRKLYNDLKDRGLNPWLDKEDLIPGQLWKVEIPKAIRECDYFIACLSERAIERQGYMHKEFRMALDVYGEKPFGSIYFIPLKFDDCEVPAIELPQLGINLRDIHWLDYWEPDGMDRLLKALGNTLVVSDNPPKPQVDSLDMEFVYIKPGTFMMGSPESEKDRYNDETLHEVTLTKGFYLQTTQVTQGQWQVVMGSNPSWFKDCGENCPVETVSWNDAQKFIQKLNRRESGMSYRLPTEAEWEYACRAGTTTPFSFGETLSTDQANYNSPKGIYREKTVPVKSFPPNAWGLYEMHGNVWEWCQDWYGDYPTGSVVDPKGPSSGAYRVLRGGSWFNVGGDLRSAYRDHFDPVDRFVRNGLRLARGQTG